MRKRFEIQTVENLKMLIYKSIHYKASYQLEKLFNVDISTSTLHAGYIAICNFLDVIHIIKHTGQK